MLLIARGIDIRADEACRSRNCLHSRAGAPSLQQNTQSWRNALKDVAFALSSLLGLMLSACGTIPRSSGTLQLGPDTYRISARASLGNPIESQKMALLEAKDYCTSLKREMVVIATDEDKNYGPFEVTFRCLNAGDPGLVRPTLEKAPDTVIRIK